jgi:hypothetical protein
MSHFFKFLEVITKNSELLKLANKSNYAPELKLLDKPIELKKTMSPEEKVKIKGEQGWSDTIIDSIRSTEEYDKVYGKAELKEEIINNRPCLTKDINMNYVDEKTGKTNKELMSDGRAPYDEKTGERIELHHMGQSANAPFAELRANSEHGGENDKILHNKKIESWRNNPDLNNQYNNKDRPNHWKERVNGGND